ncbi:hypothetical protein PF010_g28977, partial [Phytophthora fragariae]
LQGTMREATRVAIAESDEWWSRNVTTSKYSIHATNGGSTRTRRAAQRGRVQQRVDKLS